MELECDLSKINNEELLRKMWQQSEDVNRKKEIRSQLYKLRESRLRNLYQGDIMADNSLAGFGKDPLVTSHGDALADQSFQSLKSKEIRDSLSPTEMKFQSMALNNPNTSGWNVQSSKEVSPDGRGFRAETVATTDGVESVNGGIAEFKGRNEQLSSAHHQGDDKNFVKKALESSKSHLQEKVVVGDENSGRTEVRTSSTKSSSSSQVIQSSTNVEYDDGFPIQQQPHAQKYLIDSKLLNQQQDLQQRQQLEQQRLLEEQRIYEQQFRQQQHQQHVNQQERRTTEQVSTTRQNTQQKNISQNIQTQETHEQNKRYVDMDKASPEYQQHVQQLMQQPGEIISNTVEYPKPNVKMITTVKRLPDGTIVRNKRYETEESPTTAPSTRPTSTAPNQSQIRRASQQPSRNNQTDSFPHSRPSQDMVDNSSTTRYVQDTHTDDVETKFSSTKKSSSKFSTETTSETIQESDDHHPQGGPSFRPKPQTNDFSTHGFPSVRDNKPTQEYPNERPQTAQPTQGYPSQSAPLTAHPTQGRRSQPGPHTDHPTNDYPSQSAPYTAHPTQGYPPQPGTSTIPHYTDNTDNITERRVNTKDGEVIIVSSQKQSNFKTSTNSERNVETEHITHDEQPHQQIPNKTPEDFSTHGFPSVREPITHKPKNYPSEKQIQPHDQDFPLNNLPPGTRIINNRHLPQADDDDVVVVSTQKSHTAKHSTNTERVIEHEIIRDGPQGNYPRIQPNKDNGTPYNYTVTTPGEHTPQGEFPGSPKKPTNANYTTQGFPSARAPGEREPYNDYPAGSPKSPSNDYTTKGYPSATPTRPAAGLPSSHNQHPSSPRKSPSQDYSTTQGFPSVRSPSKGTPIQGHPSNVDGERPNGTAEQPRATPITKIQTRTSSPNKYKTPNTTVRETTERVIRKEKEVDSAHRAFAASLRSNSPMDHHVRRDSYTTDSHSRHTPRSSVSSTKTFRRDMREGSHESAPSETSRISTTTITRNTPPRTVGGRTVVTKLVTTKTGPGSNEKLNVTPPRATKSPSPGKTVTTTTTTTTRTLTGKDVPKVTDNQHTRITTSNKIDTIFPINEPPLTTSIIKTKFSDNHKQPHKKPKDIIRKKNIPPVKTDAIASASAEVEEVIEKPCLKKHYYKLGPSDQTQATQQPLNSFQIYEKSPTKKQSSQPQPAPSSRSSTPSNNSRKPQISVMADDYDDDDDDNLNASPFSPPSSRSRTPQKIAPNDNDKPRDDWQMPRQPDNDERRTVNRETTFEKPENAPKQPHKPNSKQPNVEWIIVDDVDDYEHDDDDNDSFAPEVVDAKLDVKKTTTKLITQEKQTPVVPLRRPKPSTTTTTTTTVTTKQFPITPSKSPIKPNDKTPSLKAKPNETSRAPQHIRANKPLTTDSRSPRQTPSKPQTKVVDNKPITKSPKLSAPSYTSPLRKLLPKTTTTEETSLKRTLKTSQDLKDKTTKLIEAEKLKRKPQSPERRLKPQASDKGKPTRKETQKTIVVTETIHRRSPDRRAPQAGYEQNKPKQFDSQPNQRAPYDSDDEPIQGLPNYPQPQNTDDDMNQYPVSYRESPNNEPYKVSSVYKKPQEPQGSPTYIKPKDEDNEPNHLTPLVRKPQDTDKPRHKSPVLRKPLSPGFQKLQSTFDERSPQFGKPQMPDDDAHPSLPDTNSEPHYSTAIYKTPKDTDEMVEEHILISETSHIRYPGREAPKRPDEQPKQQIPVINKPTDNKYEPSLGSPGYKKPEDTDEPHQGSPEYRKPQHVEFEPNQSLPGYTKRQKIYEDIIITETAEERIPKKETPKIPQSPENKSGFKKPYGGDVEQNQEKPRTPYYNKPGEETDEELSAVKPEFAPSEPDDDDECITERSESFVATSQKTVAKHIQKFETNFLKNKSPKPSRELSPIRNQNKPGRKFPKEPVQTGSKSPERVVSPTRNQKSPQEPTSKRPQSPNKHVSPNRIYRNPDQKTLMEPIGKRPQSPNKHVSPNRVYRNPEQKTPMEPTGKIPQSPNKHVSPNRVQRNPEPIQPSADRRPKSPNKHVSPQRPEKITNEEDDTFTTSLKTIKIVKEKIIKEIDDENYPKRKPTELKPTVGKPFKTQDDKTFTETAKFVASSTQKRIVNEKHVTECEEPLHPDRKYPQLKPEKVTKLPARDDSPTKNPTKSEKLPENRGPPPNKNVSPTRTQKRPDQRHPIDDQTFRKSLRTAEIVTEKLAQKVGDKMYPEEKIRYPKGQKPYTEQLSDTEEEETVTETSEFVIRNSTQKEVVTDHEIQELDKPRYHDSTRPHRDSKSPVKAVSPIRNQKKPFEKLPTGKFKEPTEKRPQSPNKHVSPTRSQKKPRELIPSEDDEACTTSFTTKKIVKENITQEVDDEEYQQIRKTFKPEEDNRSPIRERTGKIPQPPNKHVSPTRTQKKLSELIPSEDDETFTTSFKTQKIVKENITQEVDDEEYQQIRKTPKTKEDNVSPTREHTRKRPQSPNKYISPTRTQKKPSEDFPSELDKTFTTSSVTKKIVKENITHEVDDEEYQQIAKTHKTEEDNRSPTREHTGKRPQHVSPTRSQKIPSELIPSEDEETFTTSFTTKKIVKENITQEIDDEEYQQIKKTFKPEEDNRSPIREHTGKRPQSPNKYVSPTRAQKKPSDLISSEDNDTFTTSFTTQKIVKENVTQEVDDEEYQQTRKTHKTKEDNVSPTREHAAKRPQSPNKHISPTRSQNKLSEDFPSELNETFTSSFTTKKIVKENITQEVESTGKRPQSPNKHVSPTRTQKKPSELLSSEDESFSTSIITKQIEKTEEDNRSLTREPTGNRPKSPNKGLTPTHKQKEPVRDDETFKTSLTINNTVTEKTTKQVDDKQYPEERKPYNKGIQTTDKPKLYYDKPSSDDEEDEMFTETSEKVVSSKTCNVIEKRIQEPQYPIREFSPTRTQKLPEEPGVIHPTGKRPKSPVRTQKKLTSEDDIFKANLNTSVTVTEKTTEDKDIDHEYPEKTMPYKKGDKPDTKSKDRKLYMDQPSDNEEYEITSKTRIQTENLLQDFEEPIRVSSPTRKLPQEPKNSYSPTKTPTKPYQILLEDNETFTKTSKATKFVMEKTTEGIIPSEEKPKEFKPKSGKPTETDGDETFMKTTDFVFTSTNKPKYPGSEKHAEETDDNETFASHNTEFTHNISQKLIKAEQQTFETEQDLYYVDNRDAPNKENPQTYRPIPKGQQIPQIPKDRKKSPTRSPSSKSNKPKTTSPNDETFKKSLRTTEKPQTKDQKPIPTESTDTEEEEEIEDFLIETCEQSYVIARNVNSEEEQEKFSTILVKPTAKKLDEIRKPEKPYTYVETTETIEDQSYSEDAEHFPVTNKYPKNKQPAQVSQETLLPKQVPKYPFNVTEQFIETERIRKETPDGAFISKSTEPSTPSSPTFKKKGAGRSDTFDERCRQILGMETYGDTPGSYKNQPNTEVEDKKTVITTVVKTRPETVFQVKIEDCNEDDEPFSVNSVKKTLHKQVNTTQQQRHNEPPKEEPPKSKTDDKPMKNPNEPLNRGPKETEDDRNDFVQTITETTTIYEKSAKNKSIDELEPDSSEPETIEGKYVKESKKSDIKISKKTSATTSPRSKSPTKSSSISTSRSVSPTKGTSTPVKDTPKRKPSKDSLETKPHKKTPEKPHNDKTNIKDRLRSSTRKTKSPTKLDQVDGSESSPEHSPTRFIERRRSSNISVTTEIIIEHTDSDTPNRKEKSPVIVKSPQDSVYKEIIDSTVMPEKLTRRMPVTERKESAPVHRVTNKDKDSKMSRSTSENLIKVKNPAPHSTAPKSPTKTTDHRRPNKCFATKSINLSATDRLVNTAEMESVIIDIQHAKSSREPSPDKIVPTPVPANFDTGKPRYPDVVQEPEDDQPKRKPQVKNIPIFEEENNSYIGCHITEINAERSHKTTHDSLDYEEQISKNPIIEAPSSLDYTSLDKPSDEESFLTVHEKVTKFQNIAEEIKKPKTTKKMLKEDIEEHKEFDQNEHVYSTVKLAATTPQKSPELVRTISRHISKQHEIDFNDEANEDYPIIDRNDDGYVECLVNNKKLTKEFKVSHHETTTEQTTEKTAEKYQQPQEYDDHDDDDDELIPHTATHTTKIEERRQKDILNRPSVFDSRNKKPTTAAATKTPLKCNKSPVKDTEKLQPDIKSRTKPTCAATNTPTEQTIATTATTTSTTISATSNKPKQSPKRKNCDIDYELRGSNVKTGVRNIISKQTKVYSSSESKTNDSKKLTTTTTTNKKPEKHMPVRLTSATNPDEYDLSADNEMIITLEEITTTDIDTESQVVNEDLNKETNRKIPLTDTPQHHKKQPTTAHSSTNSSPTDQPLKTKTKEHLVKLTDKHPLKSNTVTTTSTTTSIKTNETIEKADDIDETVLEPSSSTKKSPIPPHTKTNNKMSTTTTDSVAARRSLFESNNSSPDNTPHTKRTPLTSPMSARRPSYMDHTKSSLEHTRRDSLEINKTNYSRKPSQSEEEINNTDRSSMVKFEVPHGKRATTPRAISVTEDIDVEEIFELDVLEKLMETVQSYEIRRRIRAQIRLIKKNQKNELISSTHSTEVTTKTTKTSKVGSEEEPDTVTTSSSKPKPAQQIIQTKEAASHVSSSSKKEYIFEEAYHPTTRRSPKPNRYPYEDKKEQVRKPTRSQSPEALVCKRNAEHERHHSPEYQKQTEVVREEVRKPTRSQSPQAIVCKRNAEHERQHSPEHQKHTELVREHSSRTTKQQYYYKDEHEQEEVHEIRHETSPTRKSPSPSRKPHSINSSPDRVYANSESRSPTRKNERSRSPQTKRPQASRVTSSRSPDGKTSSGTIRKSSATYEQQEAAVISSSTSKPQTKRITTTTTTTTTGTKSKPDDKTPVWADRKNILKTPTSTTPKKPSSSTLDSSKSGYMKTSKSTTSQKMVSNKSSSFIDDNCITSSYGIGPTDENGLPLFGIRALKKKKSTVEPSETTEEVTGYVVEEKYYSDNKTKPKVERKEFIYSTNPEELQKLKQQVEATTNRKALKDVELKESRKAALITKAPPALRSSPEDDFLDSTTKYVRRGSVKEMSEKFIQKEASSTVTEKSNYPKAGLILRTNSRKSSRDMDNESENIESYKTIRVQQHHTSTVLADSDDDQHEEYEVEEVGSRHSGRFITESESECDSIKTQKEFKKVTSSSSSSMATRSFLNSQGEEKVVTNISECLERMRNADNVVEEGDTAEDQEARALLNKFLGASIIMKGAESSLPASNRQSKIITTTTTSCNLSDDNDGDNNAKHEVKTTRITKTINSGSSSTPVTYTTCDIEEIWDEEILKELLEQARTYEERRKIRSRLRELMADREETKKSPKSGDEKEATAAVSANVPEEEESSASEYEEIIEEVTDYSEAESEVDDNNKQNKRVVVSAKSPDKDISETSQAVQLKAEEKSIIVTAKSEESSAEHKSQTTKQVEKTKTVVKTETVEEEVVEEYDDDTTDSSEKGESSSKPIVHDKPEKYLQTIMPQDNNAHNNQSTTNSQKLKTAQTSSNNNNNNKSKTAVSENSSMHASYNNNNYKTPKATSTAPTSKQNPVVTERTAGQGGADSSTSISHKSNKNIQNTSSRQANSNINSIHNNTDSNSGSGSGSLGGNSVVVGSSSDSPRQVDRLGVPQKEDSGTESGEDLRLIAAGLRDQLQIQSDSNIIEEVTCALSRLENSLKEGKDISVDVEKRKALLALVARLRAGLTSPEKLAEIAAAMSQLDGNDDPYGETSSPEADAHRSNRSRFGKRKNRVSRHTVGVSREELADARRYMEDMLLMSNISQSTTPDANIMTNSTPPKWYPLEKNASTGSILAQPSAPVLQRPKQFVTEENVTSMTNTNRLTINGNKRRPLSGEYSVSFENSEPEEHKQSPQGSVKQGSPDDSSKVSRFSNKKHLMKRANTIDLAKAHKYNPECDTDSDAEDKTGNLGLKRAVQVNVKKRVQNAVPAFEPKTENDRKFLAFINKQSDKPGLGWTNSRSVSNWTNKFGSIKSTFEGGLAGKPPQAPYHVSGNTKFQQSNKLFLQPVSNTAALYQAPNYMTNQQIALRLQREAERQAEERRRKLEKEHSEYERRERDKLERQRQQRERQERERLEREHFERQRRQQDQITAAQHAAILREQQQLAAAQQTSANMNVAQPIPVNEFKHAPQSVFRPIDSGDTPSKPIYKPIPQLARNSSNWQTFNATPARSHTNSLSATSPGQYGNTRPDNSFITSPPPSTRSPIALPWASKPTVDSSSFKSKAHRFEERSKYDNINNTTPFIQRHNSLRSSNGTSNYTSDEYRKRPSLPNAFDPFSVRLQLPSDHDPLAYLPPPQNISFTYSSLKPKTTHQSYPCLPSAVVNNYSANDYQRRLREDSLTDPHSVPLVLTSSNPSYCPPTQASTQAQQQHFTQPRLPRQFDLVSPANSTTTSPSIYNMQQTDCTDDELDSDNNLLEYRAVSRVMGKPQSQTAVTVGRRTGHVSDDELYGKNSRAARNLLSTMKSLGNSNGITRPKAPVIKRPEPVTSPKTCLSPDGLSYQAPIVEPLFPEINKFEPNRKPLYIEESKKQSTASTYSQTVPRNQMGMYKSLENLNKSTGNSQAMFAQQPPPPKPYVSETQTSYVVTYPIDDTTDDEDYSRQSQKKMMPPNSLDLRRHRKISENSTGSSTTTSMSFSQNLPSPNTSWTSNPIVIDESNNFQNVSRPNQNTNINLQHSSPAEPSYQAHSSQVTQQNQNYNPPPSDYKNMAAEYEAPTQRHMLSTPVKPAYNGTVTQRPGTQTQVSAMPNSKSSHEDVAQTQLQQTKINQKQQTPQQKSVTNQKISVTQNPIDYQKQDSAKAITSISNTTQEKKSVVSMRKTEDHHSIRGRDQTAVINPKNSNISQEMLIRLDQQRERISNEARRKSLGNTLDYQMEKQARYETQNAEVYKSSAPSDTPDIVKSSLPKDESQPILKKFGPPQRHHYMPNSYQSPNANSTSSSSVVTTSIHSTTKIQGKNLHTTTNKQTIGKTSQQFPNNTRPTVMETPATPQPDDDYIPRNIVFNNVHAFSSMARRQSDDINSTSVEQHHTIRPSKLSKSDSWNQIMMLQSQHVATSNTTKFNQSPTNELRRTKSGHTLALPKMFEAAITKTDINEKQKTVAAYFSGQKSPTQQQETMVGQMQQQNTITKRSVINRTKTSEKVSAASRKSLGSNLPIITPGLQRSATMPHIANINLLDESNVEDAFEQLIMEQKQQKSSSSTTEKTETKEKDGAVVTTTTKVTTRTVTGSAEKPASPFAKFKQLDGQNSQQSAKSPTTPKTTTVGGSTASPLSANQPIFKFTDPALNAKAATVKEQLLQWCQSKTQEYENIEITNFSTSWNNGLAFCALIHHFLPDAFDYSQLTPKNRRKNFELAFTVADEKAGIAPLLDVEDMVVMQRPDWKCVFVYVQSIYRRFRNCQ